MAHSKVEHLSSGTNAAGFKKGKIKELGDSLAVLRSPGPPRLPSVSFGLPGNPSMGLYGLHKALKGFISPLRAS